MPAFLWIWHRGHFCILICPKNTNLVEDVDVLIPVKICEFRSAVSEEKSKMAQPIRDRDGHLVFPIDPKNTNLVEGVEILLPVKIRCIPFSCFKGEVENISANNILAESNQEG